MTDWWLLQLLNVKTIHSKSERKRVSGLLCLCHCSTVLYFTALLVMTKSLCFSLPRLNLILLKFVINIGPFCSCSFFFLLEKLDIKCWHNFILCVIIIWYVPDTYVLDWTRYTFSSEEGVYLFLWRISHVNVVIISSVNMSQDTRLTCHDDLCNLNMLNTHHTHPVHNYILFFFFFFCSFNSHAYFPCWEHAWSYLHYTHIHLSYVC